MKFSFNSCDDFCLFLGRRVLKNDNGGKNLIAQKLLKRPPIIIYSDAAIGCLKIVTVVFDKFVFKKASLKSYLDSDAERAAE